MVTLQLTRRIICLSSLIHVASGRTMSMSSGTGVQNGIDSLRATLPHTIPTTLRQPRKKIMTIEMLFMLCKRLTLGFELFGDLPNVMKEIQSARGNLVSKNTRLPRICHQRDGKTCGEVSGWISSSYKSWVNAWRPSP